MFATFAQIVLAFTDKDMDHDYAARNIVPTDDDVPGPGQADIHDLRNSTMDPSSSTMKFDVSAEGRGADGYYIDNFE